MSLSNWVELSEAAKILGVHYTTLRRWADAGKLPCSRTPGGRRRFLRSDLEQFLAGQRSTSAFHALHPAQQPKDDEQNNQMIRQHLHHAAAGKQSWLERLDELQRMKFKYSGQLMLGLLMQYNSRSQGGEVYLQEAERLSQDYGQICYQAGMSITETARVFLFFRSSIAEMILDTSSLEGARSTEEMRLYKRTNTFFDALLLAVLDAYTRSAHPKSPIGTNYAADPSPQL